MEIFSKMDSLHHATFQEKLNQFRENLRTDGQTLFHRILLATAGGPINSCVNKKNEKVNKEINSNCTLDEKIVLGIFQPSVRKPLWELIYKEIIYE